MRHWLLCVHSWEAEKQREPGGGREEVGNAGAQLAFSFLHHLGAPVHEGQCPRAGCVMEHCPPGAR